jgi:hypothetical protein
MQNQDVAVLKHGMNCFDDLSGEHERLIIIALINILEHNAWPNRNWGEAWSDLRQRSGTRSEREARNARKERG